MGRTVLKIIEEGVSSCQRRRAKKAVLKIDGLQEMLIMAQGEVGVRRTPVDGGGRRGKDLSGLNTEKVNT